VSIAQQDRLQQPRIHAVVAEVAKKEIVQSDGDRRTRISRIGPRAGWLPRRRRSRRTRAARPTRAGRLGLKRCVGRPSVRADRRSRGFIYASSFE